MAASIEHSESPKVKCPFKDDNYSCDMEILEREIKAVRYNKTINMQFALNKTFWVNIFVNS